MHLFLISYFYPPQNYIASERVYKIATTYINHGHKVTVFCLDNESFDKKHISMSDTRHINEKVKIVYVKPNYPLLNPFCEPDNKFFIFLKRVLIAILWRLLGDMSIMWNKNLYKAIVREHRGNRADYLFFSGGPFGTFSLGRKFLNETGVNYFLDYRDLWIQNPSSNISVFVKKMLAKIDGKNIRYAKSVYTVSEGCKNELEKAYNKDVQVVYNFPNKQYYDLLKSCKVQKKKRPRIQLFYAGMLYKNRATTASILKALDLLPLDLQDRFELFYIGNYGALVEKEFKEYGRVGQLKLLPLSDKKLVFHHMWQADILLSLIDNSHETNDFSINGIISTKIFDYLYTGKPILNIAPKTAELNRICADYKNFYSYSSFELEQIANRLVFFARENIKDLETEQLLLHWEKQEALFLL